MPGLESLSVTQGHDAGSDHRAAMRESATGSTASSAAISSMTAVDPEQLFLQQGDHALLILSRGPLAAVLSAHNGTAPEALFWAGEEARKRI